MASVVQWPSQPPEGLAGVVARIVAGDRRAEQELVEQFGRGIRALARRHCRPNDPAADDIAQDVIVGVLERIRAGAIHDPAALPAYIRTAIVHAASAEYRRRRDRPGVEAHSAVAEAVAPHSDPHARLEGERLQWVFLRLLDELPVARDREVPRRFYLRDEDKRSVCAALGIDEGHFHRVVHRARQRFRDILVRHGIDRNAG